MPASYLNNRQTITVTTFLFQFPKNLSEEFGNPGALKKAVGTASSTPQIGEALNVFTTE